MVLACILVVWNFTVREVVEFGVFVLTDFVIKQNAINTVAIVAGTVASIVSNVLMLAFMAMVVRAMLAPKKEVDIRECGAY